MKNQIFTAVLASIISMTSVAQQNRIICDEKTCKKGDRVCKNASYIKANLTIAGRAQDFSNEFQNIRKEESLTTKVDLLLKKLTGISRLPKVDPGSFDMQKTVFKEQPQYKEALTNEIGRLQNSISNARELLHKNRLSKQEKSELEFSVNSLIEAINGRFKRVENDGIDAAENRFTGCLFFDEMDSSLATFAELGKVSVVDMLVVGGAINPLTDLARTGKYNMSLTRIEALNQKYTPSKQGALPALKGHQ